MVKRLAGTEVVLPLIFQDFRISGFFYKLKPVNGSENTTM
jgi:hypothetical protein